MARNFYYARALDVDDVHVGYTAVYDVHDQEADVHREAVYVDGLEQSMAEIECNVYLAVQKDLSSLSLKDFTTEFQRLVAEHSY